MAINKLAWLKLAELIITIVCLGLHCNSMGEYGKTNIILIAGTFVGYLIILIALFAGYILDTPVDKWIDGFLSLLGCALFIACGVIVIQIWDGTFDTDERSIALSKGALSILNGVLFLVDVIITYVNNK